jgi:hypothetical protein
MTSYDKPGDMQQDSFSATYRSVDKKAKVTTEAESETDSGTGVALIQQMLRQNSSSVSEGTRDRKETHASARTGCLQPPTSPADTSSEYNKHVTRRFDRDDIREEDERTLVISIPKFADPVAIKGKFFLRFAIVLRTMLKTFRSFH